MQSLPCRYEQREAMDINKGMHTIFKSKKSDVLANQFFFTVLRPRQILVYNPILIF